jgi:hypothetical protein
MSVYSETLPEDVMASARRAFDRRDHDNSGTIQVEVSKKLSVLCRGSSDDECKALVPAMPPPF